MSKRNDDSVDGVNCEVVSCKYHGLGGICRAENITVEAPDASRKTDTYCGTYSPQGFTPAQNAH